MRTHGGDVYGVSRQIGISVEECLDFSANINPLGTPESIRQAMLRAVDGSFHYPDPDCEALAEAISRKYPEIRPEWILCGNGGADIIYRIVQGEKPKRALVPVPTFLEYEEALSSAGTEIVRYEMVKNFELDEKILEVLHDSIDLLFLCTPNNPTGILIPELLLLNILDQAKKFGIRVVLDECFMDFVVQEKRCSMMKKIAEYKNLVIIKSFTKLYGIPGVRLGYGVTSDRDFLEKMRRAGQTWAVNTIAMAAGISALDPELDEFAEETVRYVQRERTWLYDQLTDLGFQVFDGQADYLFFYAPGQPQLYETLLPFGLIIRRCKNYPGLTSEYYRIAVRKQEENRKLVETLCQVLGRKVTGWRQKLL